MGGDRPVWKCGRAQKHAPHLWMLWLYYCPGVKR